MIRSIKIRLTRADKTLTLKRQEAPLEPTTPPASTGEEKPASLKAKMVWKSADGQTVDESKIDRLLSTAADLEAESYLDDVTSAELGAPAYTLEFKGPNTYTLSVYQKLEDDGSTHPGTSSETQYLFTLADWRTNALMPAFDDLVAAPDQSRETSSQK